MANIYSVGFPIVMPIPTIDNYRILDSRDNVVYEGRTAQMPNQTGVPNVDISPIMRQLVPTPDYGLVLENVDSGDSGSNLEPRLHRFTLVTANPDPNSAVLERRTQFGVRWAYSQENKTTTKSGLLGGGVQSYVYDNQIFAVSTFDEKIYIEQSPYNAGTNAAWVQDLKFREDATELLVMDASDRPLRKYSIRNCTPENTVILYYVDENGALAWLICDGKNTVTRNISRAQITHENSNDKDDAYKFGLDNYGIETYDAYTLNTGYLTDIESRRVQFLFQSPKVWLYELNSFGTEYTYVKAAVLTDKSVEIKNKKSSGNLFNYTIKCRTSNTFKIVG